MWRKQIKKKITKQDLWNLFDYKDGVLYWKIKPCPHIEAGTVAGTISIYGYIQIRINRKIYKRSRLVFFMFHGYWPMEVDHINRDGLDDRIENLRRSDRSVNCKNRSIYGKVPHKFITWNKEREMYVLQVRRNSRTQRLGVHGNLKGILKLREQLLSEEEKKRLY